MKTIVVTGGGGSVAKEIILQGQSRYTIIPLSKQQLDVTNEQQVASLFSKLKPAIVIHTAALTDVESCEKKPIEAIETNGIGTYYVAKEAKRLGARLIYLSSDYVFDGKKSSPLKEIERPKPLSAYGMGKLIGEKFVQILLEDATIIRTSWLFGGVGKNFVRTILEKGEGNSAIQVVCDQVGSPTYVPDLVKAMFALLEEEPGIYHVANRGSCSRYEFAKKILQLAGNGQATVQPMTSSDYPLQAPRPAYSVLSLKKLHGTGIDMRHWEQALQEYLRKEGFDDRRS